MHRLPHPFFLHHEKLQPVVDHVGCWAELDHTGCCAVWESNLPVAHPESLILLSLQVKFSLFTVLAPAV